MLVYSNSHPTVPYRLGVAKKSTVCRAWLLQSRASFTGGVGLRSMGLSSTVEIWVFLFHLVLFSWAENSLPFKEAVSQMQSLL